MKTITYNRAARLLAGFLLVVLSTLTLPAQVPVRTDGVYYLVHPRGDKNDKGEPLCLAVRFYEDQTAIESEFFGDPAGLAKWFHRDNDDLHPGRWVTNGDELTLTVSTGFSEKSRVGRMTIEGWRINERILFQFVPVTFVDLQTGPAKNRRPYFTGYGKSIQMPEYDAAGRAIGLKEEIEIAAVDPDGDPLTYTWTVSSGSIVGSGPKVIWKRVTLGESRPGTLNYERGVISVEVSDSKGGKVSASQ